MMKNKNKGFSLVELAIVLVIIGLITGGILTGQDLIRASEINSIASDANKIRVAVNTFKIKYNQLPGDMNNATSYWGTASGGCPSGASTGTQTCNGDADGMIEWDTETFRFWQHLSNAGLVGGSFSGIRSSGAAPGVNVLMSSLNGVGISVYIMETNANANTTLGKNRILFGRASTGNDTSYWVFFKPDEARSLDAKTDDGMPQLGKTFGTTGGGNSGLCHDGTNYSLTNTGISCSMIFDF